MKPMEVWSLISPIIPLPEPHERGYHMWIQVYTTIYHALKRLEEEEKKNEEA